MGSDGVPFSGARVLPLPGREEDGLTSGPAGGAARGLGQQSAPWTADWCHLSLQVDPSRPRAATAGNEGAEITVHIQAFHMDFLWGWGEADDGREGVVVAAGAMPSGVLMAAVSLAGLTAYGRLKLSGDGRRYLGPALVAGDEVGYPRQGVVDPSPGLRVQLLEFVRKNGGQVWLSTVLARHRSLTEWQVAVPKSD